jgi:hypothetical protein
MVAEIVKESGLAGPGLSGNENVPGGIFYPVKSLSELLIEIYSFGFADAHAFVKVYGELF